MTRVDTRPLHVKLRLTWQGRWNNIHALATVPRYRGRRRAMVAQQVLWGVGEIAQLLGETTYTRASAAANGLHSRTIDRPGGPS